IRIFLAPALVHDQADHSQMDAPGASAVIPEAELTHTKEQWQRYSPKKPPSSLHCSPPSARDASRFYSSEIRPSGAPRTIGTTCGTFYPVGESPPLRHPPAVIDRWVTSPAQPRLGQRLPVLGRNDLSRLRKVHFVCEAKAFGVRWRSHEERGCRCRR